MNDMGLALGQKLEQQMSQSQLQSLDMLAMPVLELRERITEELTKNPALEVRDESQGFSLPSTIRQRHSAWGARAPDSDRVESTSSAAAYCPEASDAFQRFLENIPAPRQQILHEHLREQLFGHTLAPYIVLCAERIIANLTDDGFHSVPLHILFQDELTQADRMKVRDMGRMLSHALSFVRRLDPIGCATRDFKQSLAVQARLLFSNKAALDPVYAYAIDILTHHFAYLEKTRPYALVRAVNDNPAIPYKLTQESAEQIFSLIASLNPFPGRVLSEDTKVGEYIMPTAYVERHGDQFNVKINNLELPLLTVSPEFQNLLHHTKDAAAQTYIKERVRQAKVFIGSLTQREKTIAAVLQRIVSVQEAFFLTGDVRNLRPLTQQQIAVELGVHESTVSRTVNGKYIQCQWGIFEMRYFFTNAISAKSLSERPIHLGMTPTRESIKDCIREIIAGQATNNEKLSDKKIADLLVHNYGISIARRTVAKYRKELDIGSSYDR